MRVTTLRRRPAAETEENVKEDRDNLKEACRMLEGGCFFFSRDYPLTLCQQRQADATAGGGGGGAAAAAAAAGGAGGLWRTHESRYWWNEHLQVLLLLLLLMLCSCCSVEIQLC